MTKDKKRTVLVLDDDDINLAILEKGTREAGYNVVAFLDSTEAWEYMLEHGQEIDIAVLDKMMPGVDGIKFLTRMKTSDHLRHIPVIMQTGDVGVKQMREGLEAGAYYYLTKPFHPDVYAAILQSAEYDCILREELQQQLNDSLSAVQLLEEGIFTLKTHAEARYLAVTISKLTHEPARCATGLLELLTNAIEHGNLDIGYDRKNECLVAGTWDDELALRSVNPRYKHRMVELHFRKTATDIEIDIHDDGHGFNWLQYMSDDKLLLKFNQPNGRGLAKAISSLRDIRYSGKGNEVHCSMKLSKPLVKPDATASLLFDAMPVTIAAENLPRPELR